MDLKGDGKFVSATGDHGRKVALPAPPDFGLGLGPIGPSGKDGRPFAMRTPA